MEHGVKLNANGVMFERKRNKRKLNIHVLFSYKSDLYINSLCIESLYTRPKAYFMMTLNTDKTQPARDVET